MRNSRELKELKKTVRVAGLTGGIASGKSTATAALENAGYAIVDADEISRALFARGSKGERELCKIFPAACACGALDRKKLRAIISVDPAERKKLDSFTHPLITAEVARLVGSYKQNSRVVLSAPLLFETGLGSLCDCVVCVYAPRSTRISRISARDGVSEADAANIIDAQMPDAYRATLSDFCVPSDRPIAQFTAEIIDLFDRIFDPSKR